MSERIYIRQIQIGPMANYVYLIGDMETREVMVVDPAWDVPAIFVQSPAFPPQAENPQSTRLIRYLRPPSGAPLNR